ncbi:CRISPR type III-A/MTUBE-associated RAMP protein Csm5 [Archaeoglobus fulgidus DSM 8774]|uniref:CRISPR system Cms protein Csm5 n=1 Tax=Archaeoglobus fulgidus DSM 8774 TaxID=1344584 RepID=A0A075WCW2_ARCFL|nr:type III-A CRISPR-associated RAMP protein Csm5 [Archaeoglobus fulgidus]AIG97432.1 CRISPR type III-A/MTUBE-associated RAMP protein Csm5 [Archaeoglobus fulgidus DSM 8774]
MKIEASIETLTPVHVGSGDKYLAVDFTILDGKVIFIDIPKIFEWLAERGDNPFKVAEKIAKGDLRVEDLVDPYSFKLKEVPFTGEKRRREILRHIHTAGKLYIPGSSIKGAIRTVLLWKAVKEDTKLLNFAINTIKEETRKQRVSANLLRRLDDKLENRVFRDSNLDKKPVKKPGDPKNDLMRGLRVTDTTSFKKQRVYEVNVLGTDLSILAECIDAGDVAEVEINIDEFTVSYLNEKLDFDDVVEASMDFARELVQKELEYKRYSKETKQEFKNLLKSRGLILRLGWGVGWYSTTIGMLLITHPEFENPSKYCLRKKLGLGRKPRSMRTSRNFPATRKVTSDGKPLGWVAIYE